MLSTVRTLLAVLLACLLAVAPGAAHASGPEWRKADRPLVEPPVVPAPDGGWSVEDGIYARLYSTSADRATARRLADHAARSIPALSERLGVPAGGTMEIYIAPSKELFSSIQPGETPDWADGTTWAALGLVFLHAPAARDGTAEPLEQVLDHEIVHVLLGRAFLPRVVPRWLQEGLAQFFAGELTARTAEELSVAAAEGRLLAMSGITGGFPRDSVSARVAYAQSADFIGWFAGTYGEAAVRRLIAEMAAGAAYEQAVQVATGASPDTVEAGWRAQWDDPLTRLLGLVDTRVLWGLGALGLVVGGWKRRQRTKARLAKWQAEEEAARRRARLGGWGHPTHFDVY